MRAFALCLLALAACLPARAAEPGHPLDGAVWDVAAGQAIGRDALAERLSAADVVLLGEVHDNSAHHLAQAWLIGQLRPAGIAFEMILQEMEPAIAAHLAGGGEPGGIGDVVGWEESGWPDWEIYRPLFEAWRADVYAGGGLPREALREAVGSGAAAVARDRRFVPALSQKLDAETLAALEDEMIAAHCNKLPREAAAGMVEMQRLRDAGLAAATLRAHGTGATDTGRPTVLVTGNGHARTDRGVPVYLRAVEPGLELASVGMIETSEGADAPRDYELPYDYVWFTAPAEREDPCKDFRTGG